MGGSRPAAECLLGCLLCRNAPHFVLPPLLFVAQAVAGCHCSQVPSPPAPVKAVARRPPRARLLCLLPCSAESCQRWKGHSLLRAPPLSGPGQADGMNASPFGPKDPNAVKRKDKSEPGCGNYNSPPPPPPASEVRVGLVQRWGWRSMQACSKGEERRRRWWRRGKVVLCQTVGKAVQGPGISRSDY